MEEEADKTRDMFLRQVMLYCVPPLQLYVDQEFTAIMREYSMLDRRRREYDEVRNRVNKKPLYARGTGSSFKETSIKVPMDPQLNLARQILVDQSRLLELQFEKTPKIQMSFAKAIATYLLAEASYYDKIHKSTNAIKPPNSPTQWKLQPKTP